MTNPRRLVTLIWLLLVASLFGAPAGSTIGGHIRDRATNQPIDYVAVSLTTDAAVTVKQTATDKAGAFTFKDVPPGSYYVAYALVGTEGERSPAFAVDQRQATIDVGVLQLTPTAVKMDRFEVKSTQAAMLNSIDRKVYTVGKEIQSAAGSASDLLQNVPSVQVAIDGNVSLRGNPNVLILIDGKPSALMSTANRSDVLEQMPSDSIDRIEVITNPSAKYKPDGTAGIINITLKRKRDPGYSGSVRVNVGNDRRYNVSAAGNYHTGKVNLSGMASLRQDERTRFSDDTRTHLDAASNTTVSTSQHVVEKSRPLSRLFQVGADYAPNKADKLDVSLQYNFRTFFRTSTTSNQSRSAAGAVTQDYDRMRVDPEWQKTESVSGGWGHSFADDGHEFSVEVKHERHWEHEDNHYTDVYRTPLAPRGQDYTSINPTETTTELLTSYARAFKNDAKVEAGYTGDNDRYETDFRGGIFDPAIGGFLIDTNRTNRFVYEDRIHAVYGTYGRTFGKFAALAGLRVEQTYIDTDQVTSHLVNHSSYAKFHPSMHLKYNLTDASQLQLNYSHRIRRPESDDLNPFPEYQDPFNLRAGNPRLKPSQTHSIETGYQYQKDDTTYLAAVYLRKTSDSFTQVTRYIDSTVLLTTQENLASSRSGGVELTATRAIGDVTANFSGNAFRNQIDASNLGLSSSRATTTWEAKLNANWHVSKTTQLEINSNYTAKRLTAQGERLPTYIVNFGLKHEWPDKKTACILTVSDVFDSLKERTVIDTPTLHDDVTRRRSARIVYVGVIYNFGKAGKKSKDEGMKYDTAL